MLTIALRHHCLIKTPSLCILVASHGFASHAQELLFPHHMHISERIAFPSRHPPITRTCCLPPTHQVLDNSWELGGMRLQPAGDTVSPVSAPVADLGPGTQRVCMHHLVRREGGGSGVEGGGLVGGGRVSWGGGRGVWLGKEGGLLV